MQRYITVAQQAEAEFIEKKSRFIAAIRPVGTEEEAQAFLTERRTTYWDASHNCYAYILRENSIRRYSDAGEPQGTAGLPMLEVLRREELFDVMVVVTRYFGGTLLGAGGLVRAYAHSVKLAVDAAIRQEMRLCDDFALQVPYPLYGRLGTLLQKTGAQTLQSDFTDTVTLLLRLPSDELAAFTKQLTELSAGDISPQVREHAYFRPWQSLEGQSI